MTQQQHHVSLTRGWNQRQTLTAGAAAGLIGGSVMSAIMILGRRAGVLHPTLNEHAENWLDRTFDSRERIGPKGTTALALISHMAASGMFGVGYAKVRQYSPSLPPALSGALFGGFLYLTDIVGAAPLIGLTRGEQNEKLGVVLQRLATHVIFGIVTAVAAEELLSKTQPRTSRRLHQLA